MRVTGDRASSRCGGGGALLVGLGLLLTLPVRADPVAPPGAAEGPALPVPLGEAPQAESLRLHVVESRPEALRRGEATVYPWLGQLNGRFTRQVGVGGAVGYRLTDHLGFRVSGLWNYLAEESAFNQELIDKGRRQARAASSLLLGVGALGGVEVAPIYGKFSLLDGWLGRFTLLVRAGAGLGSSRIQIRPDQTEGCGGSTGIPCRSAAFGDTGARLLGELGAALRVELGSRLALRLEVSDLLFSARVDRIDGCSAADLEALVAQGSAGSGCRTSALDSEDYPRVQKLLQDGGTDLIHDVTLSAGLSVSF